jgi:hypothetical protein
MTSNDVIREISMLLLAAVGVWLMVTIRSADRRRTPDRRKRRKAVGRRLSDRRKS